jgi:hypothetical protein
MPPSRGKEAGLEEVPSKHSMLTAYNALAERCWNEPGARERFADAAREALAVYGWEVPSEVEVSIEFVELDPGSRRLTADEVANVWRRGVETGDLRIKIATEPPAIESAELSPVELEAVSAGAYSPPAIYPS